MLFVGGKAQHGGASPTARWGGTISPGSGLLSFGGILAEIARRIAERDYRFMEATCVTVDCIDPQRVARFWGDALGWDVETPNGEQSVSCRPRDGGLYLEFVAVSNRKEYKNRVHLGVLQELSNNSSRNWNH